MNSPNAPDLRLLIVDDEPLARRRLKTMLRQIEGVVLVGEAADGEAALNIMASEEPDVVLLDIKMPGISGLDLAKAIDLPNPPIVIFVTAFNNFALNAFETDAVGYLLKPVGFDRLSAALERARSTLRQRDAISLVSEMERVIEALRSSAPDQCAPCYEREFWVQRRAEHVRVLVENVEWIKAERDYVRLYASGQSYLLRDTIRSLADRLDPTQFVRIHRSAIVRRDLITALRQAPYGAIRVALSTGDEVAVGRTYTKPIKQLLLTKSESTTA